MAPSPARRRRQRPREELPDHAFQIAPMIDVVFVVLVFFMAQTLAMKIEQELSLKLPGTAPSNTPLEFPDEQLITVLADGQVLLNDDPCDTPTDIVLGQLTSRLRRLQEHAKVARTQLLVTIQSEPEAPYERTVAVMNALAGASLFNVTFMVGDGEW